MKIEWVVWKFKHDLKNNLQKVGLVVGLLILVGLILMLSLPLLAAVPLQIFLLHSLLPYFLPCRYTVSEEGIELKRGYTLERYAWTALKSYQSVTIGYRLELNDERPLKAKAILLEKPSEVETDQALQTSLETHFLTSHPSL